MRQFDVTFGSRRRKIEISTQEALPLGGVVLFDVVDVDASEELGRFVKLLLVESDHGRLVGDCNVVATFRCFFFFRFFSEKVFGFGEIVFVVAGVFLEERRVVDETEK